ncbi:tyrosine-type recombinase/integrase [Photobacterium leiognathi]|uniref:tyrosine-type recombinase/integrase n=1 Tax=Photobacterium leiognathi TaxID=553611 RepID=UPI00298101FD|nr:tyrosine-type recombinase/integrase [Photobacterium leiognathi]
MSNLALYEPDSHLPLEKKDATEYKIILTDAINRAKLSFDKLRSIGRDELATEYEELVPKLMAAFSRFIAHADLSEEQSKTSKIEIIYYIRFITNDSPRTIKQFVHAINKYTTFCIGNGNYTSPISEFEAIRFIDYLALEHDYKTNTLNSHVFFVRKLFRLLKLNDEHFRSTRYDTAFKNARRNNEFYGKTTSKASAMRFKHIKNIIKYLGRIKKNTNLELRDCALACLAYDTMLRESEIVRLTFADLKKDHNGNYIAILTSTKNTGETKTKKQRMIWVSSATFNRINQLYAKLNLAIEADFPLIPKLNRNGQIYQAVPLKAATVSSIFTRMHGHLKTNYNYCDSSLAKAWTGHSCRVGRTEDLVEQGASDIKIMQIGGWTKVDMVKRYSENIDISNIGNEYAPNY